MSRLMLMYTLNTASIRMFRTNIRIKACILLYILHANPTKSSTPRVSIHPLAS